MTLFWGLVAAAGAVAFLTGARSGDPRAVWSIYLVNLVFWAGLAVTGRRIALTTAGFLPAAFVLFLVLVAGQTTLYPWVTTPVPVKQAWLNVPFFWLRTLAGAAALFGSALALVRALVRDAVPPDDARERARRNRLAVVLLFLWVIGVSLWGFDLVMSLDPAWYSGLFGGYFVVSTLYIGFFLLSLLTVRANARGHASIPPAAVQDVAKLQFAISIMWMYFFWSQYLVIWYGNVPVETRFFLTRFFTQPWLTLAWFVLVVGWLIPFAYLLKRLTGRPPQRHAPLVVVSVFGLVAIFLERVLVVFPSVSTSSPAPFGARRARASGAQPCSTTPLRGPSSVEHLGVE